jgi:hypothetical protein
MFSLRSTLVAAVLGLAALTPFAQTVPSTINYQGRLTDNSPTPVPVNAVVNMQFSIWDDPTAGSQLWQQSLLGPQPVTVTNGIFNVLLGGGGLPIPASVFSGGTTRYLQITANGETLTPRQVISATGYANQAQNASTADSATTAATAANATLADTATNSNQLGGVATSGWQRALTGSGTCPAGYFFRVISQSGSFSCADANSSISPPLGLSGNLSGPVVSGTNSGSGVGVYGENNSTNINVYGVHGRSSSTSPISNTAGVRGDNLSTNSNGYGVYGTHSGNGYGVLGTAAGGGYGVGVEGLAFASSGVNYGVNGQSWSAGGYGGYFSNSAGGTALYAGGLLEVVSGTNNAANNTARFTAAGLTGTKYDSHIHYGTNGDWYIRSAHTVGKVVLQDTGGQTLIGSATPYAPNMALIVQSGFKDAIFATTSAPLGYAISGQAGVGSGTGGIGVSGYSDDGGRGIYGGCNGAFCLAGSFFGNVSVNGTLSKTAGSFKIDHPLDPENKYLYHSFVESPDMKNIYDGVITTDGRGVAVVTMPDWFETLNRDFRYQLTVIGEFAQAIVGKKLSNNQFVIKTNRPNVEVSWQVTGIRKDPYAEKHRIPVEQDKPANERGLYLYPGDYDQPEEKGVEWGTHPELMQRMKDQREKAKLPSKPPAVPVP